MRVLIVEDEPFLREELSLMINWEENGFTLIGCARNGRDALRILKGSPADIIITDLKMPEMSGLELIRECKNLYPNSKFLVVSGYDEFSLVKEAFTLGVKNYFLKYEIEPHSLLEAISKVSEEIKQESLNAQKIKMDAEELNRFRKKESMIDISTRYLLVEKLMRELIWSKSEDVRIWERLRDLQISLEKCSIYIMVIRICGYPEYEKNCWSNDRESLKYAFLNIFNELFNRYSESCVFCNQPDEYVVVFSNITETLKESFQDLFECMKKSFDEYFSLRIVCGLSKSTNKFSELKDLYRDARNACDYSYISVEDKLLECSNIKYTGDEININELISILTKALESFNSLDINRSTQLLKINPDNIGIEQIPDLKNLFYEYYRKIKEFVAKENFLEKVEEKLQLYYEAEKFNSLVVMNQWLEDILNSIAVIFYDGYIINEIKNFVLENYKENITLSQIADRFQLSESHLSRVFKKSQKVNFSQYLVNVRINIAVDLLKNSNMKIYEIAEAVGYSSSQQFTKTFKKVTGKSPRSFLKR